MAWTSFSRQRRLYASSLAALPLICGIVSPVSSALAGNAPPVAADWEHYATAKVDKIVVHKGRRRMELMRGTEIVRSYHIALGHHPFGAKVEAGDGRTPEGIYYIDHRNPASDYHRALHISYPQESDVERAQSLGAEPGGAIMIHGQPSNLTPDERKLLSTDWTAGCIALTNPEIDEVWRLVDDGVTVEIDP